MTKTLEKNHEIFYLDLLNRLIKKSVVQYTTDLESLYSFSLIHKL